ncbi:hypothetical protein IW262DRAFT_1451054 [Armillaria fumosa]|nr:hypothetical protein IW262DRAFT_1451054 [Armillaria fumosa]
MKITHFKAALGMLHFQVKNGTYIPTILTELPNLADGTPKQPLFKNEDRFMKAYAEESILLHEGAFGARWDTQNQKNQLEGSYGSRPPDNSLLSARATGWIHADWEEKAATAAVLCPPGSLTKEKLKKAGKIVKLKATIRNETDLETNHVDEDIKMKGGEESVVLKINSDKSDNMSLDEEEPAHLTTHSQMTCKHHCTKHAASYSPVKFQAASHGDPPKENSVFFITSWAANFMLTSKHKTLETTLKTIAASHLGGDKLESLQIITVYQFCLKQQELIAHKIDWLSST